MREKIKNFLKNWPKIYSLLRKIYHAMKLRRLMELLLGTRVREKEWATRHLCKGKKDDWKKDSKDWIKGYWDSQDHPHRRFLLERIEVFSPITSVLEVGCCCGSNLVLLAKKFPNAEIIGIDINPMAVKKGNKWLKQEGISNVKLSLGKVDDLREFQDKNFDVVFTDAVLLYIGPDKIKKAVEEMLRKARKALILCEWHDFSEKDKEGIGFYHLGFWKRDYIALLRQYVLEHNIRVTKIPEKVWDAEGWKEYGAIVEVILK